MFVEEFQVDWNATAAAIRAGYSPTAAKDIGYENKHKPAIVEALTKAMAARVERTQISAAWVLARLVEVEKEAAGIAKSAETLGVRSAARLHRLHALKLIGQHVDVNAFRMQFGHSGPDGGPIRVWDLSKLDDQELDTFERLLAKITIGESTDAGGDPGGEGGEGAPPGEGAP